MFVFGTLTEFSTGPMVTLFFAMLADTADYSEWKTNRRATGLFYSAGTVAMKFGSGVGGALTGFLLAAFGYVAANEAVMGQRSEEHTSELQSRGHLVCRLLLEKKKNKNSRHSVQHKKQIDRY